MNKEFFETNETTDFQLMTQFNTEKLHLTDFGRCPDLYHSDASGKTAIGDTVSLELKRRDLNLIYSNGEYKISGCASNGKSYTDNTIMIEAHKAASLLWDYSISNITPLYINFLNDDVVIIYNLTKLNKIPKKKNYYNIRSKGYQRTENGDRFLLDLQEAYIYKNNKLIHKP